MYFAFLVKVFLSVLNSIYATEEIKLISTRHEGGTSFMAEGYAKAIGKPGVCMAPRGAVLILL
jgi:acetolactate synthase-1/2/3 large subunit